MKCQDCFCLFKSQACFDLHKEESVNGKSTCTKYRRCEECNQYIRNSNHMDENPHVCGKSLMCNSCNCFVEEDHLCFIPPLYPKRKKTSSRDIDHLIADVLGEEDDETTEVETETDSVQKFIAFDVEADMSSGIHK